MIRKLSMLAVVTPIATSAVLAAGCAKTDSSDLFTTGIYAAMSAHGTGSGTTSVYATLYVDGPNTLNFVDLTGDDHLVASTGSDRKPMAETELGNLVTHQAMFSTDADNTTFAIALDRTVDDGAPQSSLTLPPRFTLGPAPASGSRAADVTLTWSPAGSADTMAWSATGPCVVATQGPVGGDLGRVTIPGGSFVKPQGTNVPDTCTVTVTVTRSRKGTVDAHYGKGGDAVGSQDRTITWTSTP